MPNDVIEFALIVSDAGRHFIREYFHRQYLHANINYVPYEERRIGSHRAAVATHTLLMACCGCILMPRAERNIMPFPKSAEIEIPILLAIQAGGGELRPSPELFGRITEYFPQLTADDLNSRNKTGINTWENKVHWARLALAHKGEIDRSKYGVWRITDKGRERVSREVGTIDAAKPKEERLHGRLAREIEEIGRVFGKYARREVKEGSYSYDVVWKDAESLPRCTHVFEVQDKGNVLEALVRLKHAYDSWGSRLFLIITGEKDRDRVERLLAPLFSGAFHEIASEITLLGTDEVEELSGLLGKYQEVIGRFVKK